VSRTTRQYISTALIAALTKEKHKRKYNKCEKIKKNKKKLIHVYTHQLFYGAQLPVLFFSGNFGTVIMIVRNVTSHNK